MPLPILAVAAIVGFLVSAGVAAAVTLWPSTKGKSLLLMGPEGSGKTTLRSFLTEGTVPKAYFATAGMQKGTPKEDVKLEGLEMIAEVWDPAGDRDAIAAWHDKAKQVDVLIYLISLAEASDSRYVVRVRRDTRQLREWRRKQELKDGSRTIVVVTHTDHHDRLSGGVGSALAATAARVARETPAVRAACEELRPKYDLVAGSLVDDEACADLTARLLSALQEAAT